MTRQARRASLLAALSLLASAATAYADCAWVSWGKYMTGAQIEWKTIHALESKPDCEPFRMRFISALTKDGWTRATKAETPIKNKDSSQYLLEAQCLPDTVDPRGPKAK